MAKARKRELLFTVDAASSVPLYRQIYQQAKDAIVGGSLKAQDRLPSIRRLAQSLSISHTTIEQAYLQLAVEGYVRAVPRSGYVVEQLDTGFLQLSKASGLEESVRRAAQWLRSRTAGHQLPSAEQGLGARGVGAPCHRVAQSRFVCYRECAGQDGAIRLLVRQFACGLVSRKHMASHT